QRGDRLGVLEVVTELLSLNLLALDYLGCDPALGAQSLAQRGEHVGALGEALGEDVARAVERRLLVGHAMLAIGIRCAHESGRFRSRIQAGIGEQPVGEGLEPGLARGLRAAATLRLVWEVEILEALLGGGRLDLRRQRLVELALLRDAREDGRTALLQLAQIAQALVELAKLRVVQPAGRLLAVARDERHRRALVEELDRSADAGGCDIEFARERL